MPTDDLPIEIQVLYELGRAPSPDGYYWKTDLEFPLLSGILINDSQWRRCLRFLKSQGLAEPVRVAAQSGIWPEAQKTITCYRITSKGREVLKELGAREA